MLKSKTKTRKSLLKGTVIGLAAVLSLSAAPLNAIGKLIPTTTGAAESVTTAKSIVLNKAPKTATVGKAYEIQKATLVTGKVEGVASGTEIKDNNTEVSGGIKTDITVTYKNSNVAEKIEAGSSTAISGVFTPLRVGTYTISYYAWEENGKEYRYQYDVVAEVGKASFEFNENDANVLPNYFDASMMETAKNVALPMPTLKDDNGEEKKLEGASLKFYKPSSTAPTEKEYVLVYINSRDDEINELLTVDTANATAVINGVELAKAEAGEYTINYAYYANGQVVEIATKTFTVQKNHYKKTNADNAPSGYDLTTSFVGTTPTSASRGVALPLPTVQATTSSTNSPANESVNVRFDVEVYKKTANGNYEKADNIQSYYNKEDNTFTAQEDGDYRLDYKVYDFYGIPEGDTLRIWLDDVKDDIAPTVYMYDAKDALTLTDDGKIDYKSARENFVSEGVNRNIVIYAIGANDNTTNITDLSKYNINDNFTLTREIENASKKAIFTIKEYNDYNLIFAFGAPDETADAYTRFVQDNFAVASQMTAEQKANKEAIKQYLKDNKFLIVTHSLTNVPGEKDTFFNFAGTKYATKYANINANFKPEDLNDYKEALKELGYAYIENTDNNSFGDQTYNVYYKAKDKAGNTVENQYVSMHFTTDKSFEDKAVPTITFPSSLQENYLQDDIITFEAPTISDNNDRNIKQVVAYRYLQEDRQTEIPVTGKSTTLKFTVNENSTVAGRWYDEAKEYTPSAFILPELENGEYKIDLSEKPEGAGWVEIFVYGTDDYGNIGFYSQVVRILGSNDTKAPKLLSLLPDENKDKKQGKRFNLPTLTYSDDLVEYMSHTVDVYRVSTSTVDDKTTTEYTHIESGNSRAAYDGNKYILNAGSFVAHEAGTYRAVITVTDAGNNNIATYFDIEVTADVKVENPTVTNISSQSMELEVDQTYMLSTPTLSLKETDRVGYAGFENRDDSKKAKYYTPVVQSAETNYYQLQKNTFVGNVAGTYEIKYYVFLIKYNKPTETEKGDDKTYAETTDDNMLKLHVANGNTYFVKPDFSPLVQEPTTDVETGELVYPIDKVTLKAYAESDTEFDTPVESILTTENLTAAGIELIKLDSQVQKIIVKDNQAPTFDIDETEYTTHRKIGDTITIQRISGTDNSKLGINPETSYVEVTISRATGGSSTEQVYMKDADWTKQRSGNLRYENNELRLVLAENGNYRIRYSVTDFSGNTTSKEYSFANGDAVKPTIKVLSGFTDKQVDEYKIGDTLSLDISKLEFTDNQTDAATLKQNLKVTVRNTTSGTTIEHVEDLDYSFKLDTAGDYEVTVTTTDAAGWTGTAEVIKISIAASNAGDTSVVYQVVGTILIVISCLILVGIVGYFIYSKVKLDKETKGTTKKKKSNKK